MKIYIKKNPKKSDPHTAWLLLAEVAPKCFTFFTSSSYRQIKVVYKRIKSMTAQQMIDGYRLGVTNLQYKCRKIVQRFYG